ERIAFRKSTYGSEFIEDSGNQRKFFLALRLISVLGSACLYRALLERCWQRKMAMICRFCSRANQKVRLVALVPHMSEKNEVSVHSALFSPIYLYVFLNKLEHMGS
uniref:Ku domain-containing protein n=1 Tax=Angiostrongylus cantonensis TaxID=6313 RepID=A0A0K0DEI6_ANGCA